jgi:hypothetical protein
MPTVRTHGGKLSKLYETAQKKIGDIPSTGRRIQKLGKVCNTKILLPPKQVERRNIMRSTERERIGRL